MAYATISFRPTKKDLNEFKHIVEEEEAGKSDAAREVFQLGLRAWRESKALDGFARGKLSLLAAAEEAGLTAYEFLELVKHRKLQHVSITDAELDREMALAGK